MDKPHDKLIRKIFDDPANARDLLEAVLPSPITSMLDLATLERAPGDFIDEKYKEFYTDLLYKVRTKGGDDVVVYALVEHKSQATKWLVVDLLAYAARILQAESRIAGVTSLPIIIPIGIVHDTQRKQTITSLDQIVDQHAELMTLLGSKRLDFGIFLAEIEDFDDDVFLAGPASDVIKVTFLALKYARTDRLFDILTRIRHLLRELLRTQRGTEVFHRLVDYTIRVAADIRVDVYAATLTREVGTMAGEIVTTTADRLREEGFQLGIKQGVKQGIELGKTEILLKQLETRFGSLSKDVSDRLGNATSEEIDAWSTAIFEAASIEDVFSSSTG